MALSETLAKYAAQSKHSAYCSWAVMINRLSPADQKAVAQAIEKKIPVSLLIKALRAEGHRTSNESARAHLKGDCRCPKD